MPQEGKSFQYLINGIGIFIAIISIAEIFIDVETEFTAANAVGVAAGYVMIVYRLEEGGNGKTPTTRSRMGK